MECNEFGRLIRPRLADGSVDEEYDGDGAGAEIPGHQDRSKAQHSRELQIPVEQNRCAMACQGCGAVLLY